MPRQPAPRRSMSPRSSRDALTAAHSSGATTARKSSTRTTRTPGSCATEASSTLDERGAERRRPDHAPVEHAGHAEVLDVLVAARALGRDVGPRRRLADPRVLRRRDERRLRVDWHGQAPAADQGADADAAAARQLDGRTSPAIDEVDRPALQTRRRRDRGAPGAPSPPPAAPRCLRVSARCCRPCRRCSDTRGISVDDGDAAVSTPSSSAAICAIAMRMPVPTSTLLVKTVTEPSGWIASELSTSFGSSGRPSAPQGGRRLSACPPNAGIAEGEADDEAAGRLEQVAPIHRVTARCPDARRHGADDAACGRRSGRGFPPAHP